jgi:superfamily II DNA/RNA helicase
MMSSRIYIKGEKPDEIPNPASTEDFLARHPRIFAPLQSETFERVKALRHLALVAPTSSGKTLAISAPLFELKRNVVFVYPYRALMRDQHFQLIRYSKMFGLSPDDFATLQGGDSKADVARACSKKYLLVTPDKLISLFLCARDRVYGTNALAVLGKYDFVFDEVHAYNSLMRCALVYFLRSVRFWQSNRREERKGRFYFLSATFPEHLWPVLKDLTRMTDEDKIEGLSYTGNIELLIRPAKSVASFDSETNPILEDITRCGIERNTVCIFNSAYKAWRLAEALKKRLGEAAVLLYLGQEKLDEKSRQEALTKFEAAPDKHILIGSPAIEAGVDFKARNFVIEETLEDSFLQRFGRAGRSGQSAFVLCYSDVLCEQQRRGALQPEYERREFLDYLRVQSLFPLREPTKLFEGLAAYQFYRFWGAEADQEFCEQMEPEHLTFCRRLNKLGVEPTLAVRGFIPYTKYWSGETVSFRAICWRGTLNVDEEGKVKGKPSPERYFAKRRQKPIFADIRRKKDIAHTESSFGGGQAILAKVDFRQDRTHRLGAAPQWTVLTITKANSPNEARGDNLQLRLPEGKGSLGVRDDGTPDPQRTTVRFLAVDE